MKVLLLVLLGLLCHFSSAQQCTQKMQIACVDDFRAAYVPCEKAAKSGGSDIVATLSCLKYFNKMKPECWPCICLIAKELQLEVKGC